MIGRSQNGFRMIRLTAIACGLLLTLAAAHAAERARADIACAPTATALVYDCTIALTRAGDGSPVQGAEVTIGAEMPAMPMAHNVRPVRAEPADAPGRYRARLELEMTGEWAVRIDVAGPLRDRVVRRLHFGDDAGHSGHK